MGRQSQPCQVAMGWRSLHSKYGLGKTCPACSSAVFDFYCNQEIFRRNEKSMENKAFHVFFVCLVWGSLFC